MSRVRHQPQVEPNISSPNPRSAHTPWANLENDRQVVREVIGVLPTLWSLPELLAEAVIGSVELITRGKRLDVEREDYGGGRRR